MGCDITMVVEARGSDGAWAPVDMVRPCPICSWRGVVGCAECEEDRPGWVRGFDWRDYTLFHRLAGVRGFEPYGRPIAEPRGLPEDASESTREALMDLHSQSWLLLGEAVDGTRDFELTMWRDFLTACEARGQGHEHTRLVFGFDS